MSGRREFLLAAGAVGNGGRYACVRRGSAAGNQGASESRGRLPLLRADLCVAGEGLLQAEGFSEISYEYRGSFDRPNLIVDGEADFGASDISSTLVNVDKSQNLVVLGGMHVAATNFHQRRGREPRDLKGKRSQFPDCIPDAI